MKTMEGQMTYSGMMMRMERAMGWNLDKHSSTLQIRTTLPQCLRIHYLERAAVLTPQTKIMQGPPKSLKQTVQARGGFREKKNGFLTL
jgi:glycosyltransferase A (GT-A) superfamily protein (DUF2064 family)